MSRRVSLPGASELFRTTQAEVGLSVVGPESSAPVDPPVDLVERSVEPEQATDRSGARRRSATSTGRVRHDEKITVYVSVEELLALEEARLRLRAEHGVAVDRGRIVREAISAAMADFSAHGAESELVRRLTAS